MKTSFRLLFPILAVTCGLSVATIASAQTSSPDGTAAKKSMRESAAARRKASEEKERARQERAKAMEQKDYEAMEARKRKKTECGKQAKQQGLHLLKRRSFMKKCMAG